jgi:hypothetical protein
MSLRKRLIRLAHENPNGIREHLLPLLREAVSVPDRHQLKILKDTVKNPTKGLLGGPSAKEAEKILREKFNYSKAQIARLKRG